MDLSRCHYVLREKPRLVFINQNASAMNRFSLEDLLSASNVNFVKGTFGSSSEDFYKVTLKNGIIVRVKIMDDVNVTSGKFKHHMEILGRIKHKNCAKPKAYCFSDDVVLLVHDDFNHENLSDLLNGKFDTRKPLSLKARLKIALTTAKGIVHIHRLFVHGNIRSSSILINRKNAAIITDTALWKVTKQIGSSVLSHQGYLAPEVKHMWNLSQASDVYSFGIVLLELLTRRSSQVTSLVSFVRKLTHKALDPELRGCDAAKKVLTLAMNCVEDAPEQRPKMDVVVKRLDDISGIYEEDQSKPSMYDFEDVRPGIGSRLEDGLEVITMMPQWQL